MNQKIDTALTLGMQLTNEQLEKSLELQAGYEEEQWEVIIRYSEKLDAIIQKYPNIQAFDLLNHYGVLIASGDSIEALAKESQIIYMEKPKRLYYEAGYDVKPETKTNMKIWAGKASRNMEQSMLSNQTELLTGSGVLLAVIDTGINLEEKQFRNKDGTTRVVALLDQITGREYSKQEIDILLGKNNPYLLPGRDTKGHGNDVTAIAAGEKGIAPMSSLLIVRMGMSKHQSFPRTTNLMRAVDYCIRKAEELQMPLVINISFGNNYGSHRGDSLVETYIDSVAQRERTVICVGSGNEGLGNTHAEGLLESDTEEMVEVVFAQYETSISLQIWKNAYDEIRFFLQAPDGTELGEITQSGRPILLQYKNTSVYCIYGQPTPFSMSQEIYLDFTTKGSALEKGVWKIRLKTGKVKEGKYDMYLPAISSLNIGTGFAKASSHGTCTIPGWSQNVITVGAFDDRTMSTAAFSGRGNIGKIGGMVTVKPELLAPGVEIMLPDGHTVTGTSFATPFVSGRAALLLEYGIVKRNDSNLYGAKMKAQFIKETEALKGITAYPSEQIGWGVLTSARKEIVIGK